MYNKAKFWPVGIISGLLGGLIGFVLLLVLLLYVKESVSSTYLLVYIYPFFYLAIANIYLRERYQAGILKFGTAFRLSLLSGFIASAFASFLIFLVFEYVYNDILANRVHTMTYELISSQNRQSNADLVRMSEWISQMLSPIKLALYYFAFYLLLLPFQALIIAIFVWRKQK